MYIYNPSTIINVVINFTEVHFESISSHGRGSCLYAVSDAFAHNIFRNGSAQLIMKDITAVKNSQLSEFLYIANHNSIFAIENFDFLILSGNSSFTHNYGSVFGTSNTKVILSGQLLFENNTGTIGSAFNLIGSSRFILQGGLFAAFTRNSALTSGGAIYAYNDITNECMYTPNGSDISMLFRHNAATYSGNSIFSNNLYNCSTQPENFNANEAKNLFDMISNGTLSGGLSTTVHKFCVCQPNSSDCTKLDNVIAYPGIIFYFSIAAIDAFNQITFTEISLNLLSESYTNGNPRHMPSLNWYIDSNGRSLSQNKCTLVNVTLFKRHRSSNIVNYLNYHSLLIANIDPCN